MAAPSLSYTPRLAPGSTILVSGVNGLIASHTADQALLAGYRVRGTVRSIPKASWLTDYFTTKYGQGKFELVEVPDIAAEGAFDAAVKGVAGVAHIASVLGSYDPDEAVKGSVDTNLTLLKSAAKEPSIKAVVITSSSMAQALQTPNKVWTIDQNTWNDYAEEHAYDKPYGQDKALVVYGASKVFGEKASWKFVKENKVDFVLNTVLPAANFGKILNTEKQGYPSTIGWLRDLFLGNITIHPYVLPQHFIDVQDAARLHLAALIDPTAENERILAYTAPHSWNQLLAKFRKDYPDRKFVDDLADQGEDLSTVKNERSIELIKRLGKDGLTGLDQSVNWTIETLL